MTTGNPNHPIVRQLEDHWHTIALVLIHKYDLGHVVITSEDLASIQPGTAIVANDKADGLHIYAVSEAEGTRLAKKAGGLPT